MITDIKGTFELHNGVKMPYFGLGVFRSENGSEVINAVNTALDAGYRLIDTASMYANEEGVGKAIKESGVDRGEIFVTTKVWNSDQGYDSTIRAFNESMKKLNLDYLDLYLIHWPVPDKYNETWKAFEYLYKEGKVRAIGVSNFLDYHIESLIRDAEIVPMVNQMEFHPFLVQQDQIDYCTRHKIYYEAWSPLMRGEVLKIDVLKEIGEKYDKSTVQVVLRWDLQKGVITIPKSIRPDRIISNADIFDFELTSEDVSRIDSLDRNKHFGVDPHLDITF
jgi:diketogulonate reductase-like aldo/keto reductase